MNKRWVIFTVMDLASLLGIVEEESHHYAHKRSQVGVRFLRIKPHPNHFKAKPVGSFFLCSMILLSFAAVSSAYVELGTATILNDSYNFSGLCDASTAEVPSNELYAIGVNIFNDGAACGMIYTVACEAGNCVAENNISVDVKIIDGISDPHPWDKTLTMILSRPAFNKIASINATSISINYCLQ